MTKQELIIYGTIQAFKIKADGMAAANMQCVEKGQHPPYGDNDFMIVSLKIKKQVEILKEDEIDQVSKKYNIDDTSKLPDGTTVKLSIPFIYDIRDTGYYTDKELRSIKDCKNEVLAEIEADVLKYNEALIEVRSLDIS